MAIKDIDLIGGKRLPINEFTFDKMVDNASIVMIAKRGSGKSWITKAILKHYSNIPMGIIIAPTDRMSTFYGTFYPDTYVHYSYKPEVIENLLQRQTIIIEKAKRYKKQGKKIDPRAFIIMDDCLASKGSWAKDQSIQELLMNGRHYELMYILTMQFPLGITPELRCNFDYIFLLADDNVSNQKRLYDHYAGMFPSFASFRQIFTQITKDFGAMVINNRGQRESFLEKIFWYVAPDLTSCKIDMGCGQFRKFHERNYNPKWRTKKTDWNIEEFVNNKKMNRAPIQIARVDEH